MRNGSLALALALVLAGACFSDKPDGITDPAPAFLSCAAGAPAPPADARVVRIRNFAFEPAQLAVPRGTTVHWVNCEDNSAPGFVHTATSNSGVWDSRDLLPQGIGTFSRRFDAAGSFPYFCRPHPFMTAAVTVQ